MIMDDPFKQHGAFSWCSLMVNDVAAAKTFYTKLFGWDTEEMNTAGMAYTVVKAGGEGIGGISALPNDAPRENSPMWGVYVTVDNVDATAETAKKLGAKLLVPPQDIPTVGRFCVIQDPQGAVISAITYLPK
jgi:predicted enzyme related to lactoylglutathione lyase